MSKTLSFAYKWCGPKWPITNNRVPTLADINYAMNEGHIDDDVQAPVVFQSFENKEIISAFKIPQDKKYFYELNFTSYYYRDWTKIFSTTDGPFVNNPPTSTVRDQIQNGNGYVLVTIPFEGWATPKHWEVMTRFFNHYEIPLDKVVYFTNCANGQELYNKWANGTVGPKINVEYFPTFKVHRTNVEQTLLKEEPYKVGPREKDFLCFQRRYSDHRLSFFIKMFKRNLLDKFYMSMDSKQPESSRSFESNVDYLIKRYPNLGIAQEDIAPSKSKLPLVLDNPNFNSYPMEATEESIEHFFKNSLINIISETFFFTDEIHITEKTYKPIAYKQPFIMMGAKGSLQHIKNMGFKTFDQWWSEDYDNIADPVERINRICDVVHIISGWSDLVKLQFTKEVAEIVEYNFNLLKTIPNTELDLITEKYGN